MDRVHGVLRPDVISGIVNPMSTFKPCDTTGESLIVDTSDWARYNEVIEYAVTRGITTSAAIRELVNAGLSHQ